MSSDPCIYIDYGGAAINGRPGLRVAVHRRPKSGRRLSLQPIGYSPALSVTYSTNVAAVAACGAI